jgi:hypothetical protein
MNRFFDARIIARFYQRWKRRRASAEGCAAARRLAQERMTARAAGAMVRPATEQQTSPTVCRAA